MIRKLVNFANIVQKGPGEQQVAVDLGIIAADDITGAKERDNVVEQSANVSVMQTLGSRGIAVRRGNFGIGHEWLDQRPEMLVLESCHKACKRLPEFADVL